MSTFWKIIIGLLIALAILVVICIGGLIWGYQWMQGSAKAAYGGPLNTGVSAIVGADFQSQRVAVFTDKQSQMVMIVLEKLHKDKTTAPFSEPDPKKAVSSFDETGQIASLYKGIENGRPADFKLGKHSINAVVYPNARGQNSIAGVLNLDSAELVFIGMGRRNNNFLPDDTSSFLNEMPIIKQDSRF